MVLGATVMFGPLIWLFERWSQALLHDPANTWGARWLGEQLSAHPYLTVGALLFGVALSSGLVMAVLVICAKRLAARLAGHARSGNRGTRP